MGRSAAFGEQNLRKGVDTGMDIKLVVKLLALMGAVALLVASLAQAKHQPLQLVAEVQGQQPPPAGQQGPGPQRTPPEPKNLQVFKGDTHDQVIQEMRKMTAGLTVECSFCHHAPGFEADTPRKEVARLMVRDYVQGMKHKDGSPLTCNDCHKGQANFLRTSPFEASLEKPVHGLQIFKDVPSAKLMEAMNHFTKALGVDCRYCHAADFDDETPRKQIARYMITEFSSKLVKQDGSPVGCDDCHKGHARPLSVLPFPRHDEHRPTPPPEKKPGV
jgi:nitrate/TMAO reductase-like tetraheme cytochrome c subunit